MRATFGVLVSSQSPGPSLTSRSTGATLAARVVAGAPRPGSHPIRYRRAGTAGGGAFTADFAWPEPDPPPVTTIAWRLCHLLVGVFGMRVAAHFGGPPVDYGSYDYPGDAATALARLDEVYAAWIAGVRGLGPGDLPRPCGPAEGPYGSLP